MKLVLAHRSILTNLWWACFEIFVLIEARYLWVWVSGDQALLGQVWWSHVQDTKYVWVAGLSILALYTAKLVIFIWALYVNWTLNDWSFEEPKQLFTVSWIRQWLTIFLHSIIFLLIHRLKVRSVEIWAFPSLIRLYGKIKLLQGPSGVYRLITILSGFKLAFLTYSYLFLHNTSFIFLFETFIVVFDRSCTNFFYLIFNY